MHILVHIHKIEIQTHANVNSSPRVELLDRKYFY